MVTIVKTGARILAKISVLLENSKGHSLYLFPSFNLLPIALLPGYLWSEIEEKWGLWSFGTIIPITAHSALKCRCQRLIYGQQLM